MKQVETTREAIINRRSVRKYKTDMIPRDIIERIVEAGTYAANGRGHQASIILAVTNKELRDRLSEMNRKIGGWDEGFDPFYGAPVVLVVLAEKDWPTHVYDGSLVMGNLMLAAHTEGTGIEIPYIQRDLITVIFYYQISLKPLKTLSLSHVSFPLCYIFPYEFTNSDKGKKII